MATTLTTAQREAATAVHRNRRTFTLVAGEDYTVTDPIRGASLIGVALGLSPNSRRYDDRRRIDVEIRGIVDRFVYDTVNGIAWMMSGNRGSSYRANVANLSPEMEPNHMYRLFTDGGHSSFLLRCDAEGGYTIMAETNSTDRVGRILPRKYIGDIPETNTWLEVVSPGVPADTTEATTESAEPAVVRLYTGDTATVLAGAKRNDDNEIVLNPERVVGKQYIAWQVEGTPYFTTWMGDLGFAYWGRQATYFRDTYGIDATSFQFWVEHGEQPTVRPAENTEGLERLDALLAREEYEFELLWTTTHRLAREQQWCGSYDEIVSAFPMEMPRRGADNVHKVMPEWAEWLEARNSDDPEPEEQSYMVDLMVRADVHWDSAPTSFDRWMSDEHLDNIDGFTAYEVQMNNVSMTITNLAVDGEWTAEQATMDNANFRSSVEDAVTSRIDTDTTLIVDNVNEMNPFGPRIRVNEDI